MHPFPSHDLGGTCVNANPVASQMAVTAKSATQVTLDFEDDGNDTWEIYCLWATDAPRDEGVDYNDPL